MKKREGGSNWPGACQDSAGIACDGESEGDGVRYKKRICLLQLLFISFVVIGVNFGNVAVAAESDAHPNRYEYKLVRLGSLTALQGKADDKHLEVEGVLNAEGRQGWEMVSIFAVRTTFDPNVFFAVMKRQMPDPFANPPQAKEE